MTHSLCLSTLTTLSTHLCATNIPTPSIFTARRHASTVYAVVLCLSQSVTSRCSAEMAKRRIMQIMPHDSPRTLSFAEIFGIRKLNRVTPQQTHQMQVW